jgi:hypothetical protein
LMSVNSITSLCFFALSLELPAENQPGCPVRQAYDAQFYRLTTSEAYIIFRMCYACACGLQIGAHGLTLVSIRCIGNIIA